MKLSVIVPCYNVSKYVSKCIDSIIDNEIDDMEIILVNDGSKDDTLNILKEYEKKYKYIKVIDKENGGLSDARNTGLRVAKGEYVAFIDSDDTINKKMFKDMLGKADTGDYDLITCGVKMVYSDHTLEVDPGFKRDLIGKEEIKKQMYDFYPAACNKLFKREKLGNLEFKKGIYYEDVEFIYRLLPNLNNIGYVEGYYYEYLQREDSITYTYSDKLYDMINNFDGIFEYYKKNKIFLEYKEEIEYVYVRYAFATFIKRLAKCKDKNKFSKGVDYAINKVKTNFPQYKKNKYLMKSKKGLYLKYFNRFISRLLFLIERNKLN